MSEVQRKRNRNPLGISTRCTAMSKRSGKQCKSWALIGADKCRMHRGVTVQSSKEMAQERILAAADPAAAKIVWLMHNGSEAIQFSAARDLLDRAGIGTKQELDVVVKKWEHDIEGLIVEDNGDIVDAEVVEDEQPAIPPSDAEWRAEAGLVEDKADRPPKYPRGTRLQGR